MPTFAEAKKAFDETLAEVKFGASNHDKPMEHAKEAKSRIDFYSSFRNIIFGIFYLNKAITLDNIEQLSTKFYECNKNLSPSFKPYIKDALIQFFKLKIARTQISKFCQEYEYHFEPLLGTLVSGLMAKFFQAGNCGDQNSLAAIKLYPIGGFEFIKVTLKKQCPHFLLVLNRNPRSDLQQPGKYGDQAIILDCWSGHLQPASPSLTKMDLARWGEMTGDENDVVITLMEACPKPLNDRNKKMIVEFLKAMCELVDNFKQINFKQFAKKSKTAFPINEKVFFAPFKKFLLQEIAYHGNLKLCPEKEIKLESSVSLSTPFISELLKKSTPIIVNKVTQDAKNDVRIEAHTKQIPSVATGMFAGLKKGFLNNKPTDNPNVQTRNQNGC